MPYQELQVRPVSWGGKEPAHWIAHRIVNAPTERYIGDVPLSCVR